MELATFIIIAFLLATTLYFRRQTNVLKYELDNLEETSKHELMHAILVANLQREEIDTIRRNTRIIDLKHNE